MTEQVTLETCPFCGGEAGLEEGGEQFGIKTYSPFCRGHACLVWNRFYETEAQAIAAWNTRAASVAEKDAEIAQLREALEDCANPLGHLRKMAEREGRQLSGMAYRIANDPATIRGIARAALGANHD